MPLEDLTVEITHQNNIRKNTAVPSVKPTDIIHKRQHNPYANVLPVAVPQHISTPYAASPIASEVTLRMYQQQMIQMMTTLSMQAAALSSCAPPSPNAQHGPSALTKVYQNGRPIPTLRSTSAEGFEDTTEELPNDIHVKVEFPTRTPSATYLLSDVCKTLDVARPTVSKVLRQYVVVEGDRGIDVGIITSAVPAPTSPVKKRQPNDHKRDEDEEISQRVLRRATEAEVLLIHSGELRHEEITALEFARAQCRKLLHHADIDLVDAVFQFDRLKLTLYYSAPERVYFVPLLKSLNQQYRCRIWMHRVDDDTECVKEAA